MNLTTTLQEKDYIHILGNDPICEICFDNDTTFVDTHKRRYWYCKRCLYQNEAYERTLKILQETKKLNFLRKNQKKSTYKQTNPTIHEQLL